MSTEETTQSKSSSHASNHNTLYQTTLVPTTTTTTTTGAPKISCGVVPPISNIVAPDAIRLLSVRGPAPGEKIVGGTLADVGAWPWAVLIGKKFSNGHFQVLGLILHVFVIVIIVVGVVVCTVFIVVIVKLIPVFINP